jgi:hypothetical protein|tara:strand:+ start:353 stop:592 length:240 start_codon:yes stop_codon:yes gene_type:complete
MARQTRISRAFQKKDLQDVLWCMLQHEFRSVREGNPELRFGGQALSSIIRALQDERLKGDGSGEVDDELAEIIQWVKEE